MSIEVQNLTKIYGKQKAVSDISFTANKGEILGLLGPNGAGKTTTMKMITCFMPASSGTITVSGLNAGKEDFAIKQKIGYLPEHNPLYGSMYVKEYLKFVAQIHKLKNSKKLINNTIERVGLGREQAKRISELSKGYKQRVGIAQALIHDPEVLILDEPISGLDPNQLLEIRNLISELKKDKTIIFSSHILQEVESICDKIVILDKGEIVAIDSINDIGKTYADEVLIELETLNPIMQSTFANVSWLSAFESIGSNKYALKINSSNDVREEIFDIIVASNNKLLSLNADSRKLENIFKSVTSKKV